MSAELSYRGDVAVLLLNRPAALNALNRDMLEGISAHLDTVGADGSLRALLLVGSGPKAFCAGADVSELLGGDAICQEATARRGQMVFHKLSKLRIPSLAVVTGVAFGGGLELAMACTLRIATQRARFGLPEIKLGLIPGYGGTQRLPRLVGESRAMELILSGRAVGADEALRIGLIHSVTNSDRPVDAGIDYLDAMTPRFPSSVQQAMEAVRRAGDLPLDDGLALEAKLFAAATQSEDAERGIRAFLEKSPATFSGR